MHPLSLSGKVVLVTGGNRGIGFGMVQAMARAGADVVIWGSNPARNDEALAKLANLPVRSFAQTVDVSREAEIDVAMAALLERMGRLDACFANAGISPRRERFPNSTIEEVDRVFAVNLDGVYATLRAASRHMRDRALAGDPGGSLVAMSSLGALHGMPQASSYAMSKSALGGLVRSLAVELARFGVRANAIAPGWIETDMNANLNAEASRVHILPRVPARRWGTPDDFGGIAIYLASNASAYHTGDNFMIDGGYSIF
jgi:NAD(P)-dependent dehydrogenase (short-subunit alcohol dehydrogenase family)